MSCLLCPSPILLDHSFPRNEEELRIVASALGELEEFVIAVLGLTGYDRSR